LCLSNLPTFDKQYSWFREATSHDTASEAVYELVADTISEPQAGEPQAEAAAEPEGGVTVDAPRRWMDGPDVHYPKENVRQANII